MSFPASYSRVCVCLQFARVSCSLCAHFYCANKAHLMYPTGRREGEDSSTYMWTVARTHGMFLCFSFSPSGVACLREHLAEMWRGSGREGEREGEGERERERGLFCFPALPA